MTASSTGASVAKWPLARQSQTVVGPPSLEELRGRVRAAGLLDRTRGYYVNKILFTLAMQACGWTLFAFVGRNWWQVGVAVVLGFASVQTALLMHDAGHSQIARRRTANVFLCDLHANLLLGISAGWWTLYHNRHHNHPNHVVDDPTVRRLVRTIRTSQDQSVGPAQRALARKEPVLFFPRYAFAAFGLRLASLITVLRASRPGRKAVREAVLLAIHYVGYGLAVGLTLDFTMGVTFVAVHYAVSGLYFGATVAPNHTGMALQESECADWLQRQLVTTRNLKGSWLVDFLYGGLNLQIEHHLFPGMARPNLRRCRPIVKAYCEQYGLPYYETGVLTAYTHIVRYLIASTSLPARPGG